MSKIIIGFTGLLSSGKGTATKYLEQKYNAKNCRFSSILRDLLTRIYMEHSRDNLIRLSETIRTTFGENILAKAITEDAKNSDAEITVVDGVRRLVDIENLAKLPNFILVAISADPKIRYERLIKRGENIDDKNKTYEQFLADHQRSTETSILDVIPHAKENINNNGSTEDLYIQLDTLVNKYTK